MSERFFENIATFIFQLAKKSPMKTFKQHLNETGVFALNFKNISVTHHTEGDDSDSESTSGPQVTEMFLKFKAETPVLFKCCLNVFHGALFCKLER